MSPVPGGTTVRPFLFSPELAPATVENLRIAASVFEDLPRGYALLIAHACRDRARCIL